MFKKILIIAFATSISLGCASNREEDKFKVFINKNEIKIYSIGKDNIQLDIPDPRPVKMKAIKWRTITKENSREILLSLEKSGKTPILFGLTDDDYENLSLNMLELQNYIESNNIILLEYRKFYENQK